MTGRGRGFLLVEVLTALMVGAVVGAGMVQVMVSRAARSSGGMGSLGAEQIIMVHTPRFCATYQSSHEYILSGDSAQV